MNATKNKEKLIKLIECYDGYKGDYEDGLDTLSFQEF